ncbi:hypothetical protein QBC37DRAFT_417584 [Rhypophila decipiens]|uniref:TauD/TfdA-like domain-containing protein n=1 Tax=Rhypophila decipiens TaxID=261697 RepID=A0AAN6YCY2_9PEZI|nr:hypothetical protein QBC37DRAFT_417584 [Rhypophila decipiens]
MASYKTITVKELHPTFGAEIQGISDHDNLTEEQLEDLRAAIAKYGFLLLRNTHLTDESHIRFTQRFVRDPALLDTVTRYLLNNTRKLRYHPHVELFDAGNLDDSNTIIHPSSPRAHSNRGNRLFHTDSSFNPRRASFSLLRAVALPPTSTGGNTEFADSRSAWDHLPQNLKHHLLAKDYIGAFSIAHSRKLGSPEFFKSVDPSKAAPMARHKILQVHEPSGRMNLYIGAHLHHLEDSTGAEIPEKESSELIDTLNKHATQENNVVSVQWEQPGDVIIWDNRAVLHRAGEWTGEGKYARDLRRTTVHDDGTYAWGLNDVGTPMPTIAGLLNTPGLLQFAATQEGVKV